MENALNTSAWLEPNTFMDIVSPKSKKTSPRNQPDRSKTLMRSAVKRPDFGISDAYEPKVEQRSTINRFGSDLSMAAASTSRSPLISRYSEASQQFEQPEQRPAESFEVASMNVEEEPLEYAFENMDSEPIAVALEQPSINIFKNNLSVPGSIQYSQPYKSKVGFVDTIKHLSGWSVLAIAVIGIITGGIIINRNLNRVELYMASSKAGFAATLPSTIPSGYDLSGIGTGAGTIEASFKSNSDNRAYSINEKKSSVTSVGLLNNYVADKAGLNYQTIGTNGKTIYVYGGHDATWVSNGIWYVIQDNNSLSDHQIMNIANSM